MYNNKNVYIKLSKVRDFLYPKHPTAPKFSKPSAKPFQFREDMIHLELHTEMKGKKVAIRAHQLIPITKRKILILLCLLVLTTQIDRALYFIYYLFYFVLFT